MLLRTPRRFLAANVNSKLYKPETMSYIISITRKNIPNADKEAWKYLDMLKETESNKSATDFIDLINKFLTKYPCICNLTDNELEEGVWSDGPLIDNAGENVTTLGLVNSSVENTLKFVIETSNNLGFVVFDYQTGIISRPGKSNNKEKSFLKRLFHKTSKQVSSNIANTDTSNETLTYSSAKVEYQKEFKSFLSELGYKPLKNGHGTFYTEIKNEVQYSLWLGVTNLRGKFETNCHIGIGIVPIQKILILSLEEEVNDSSFYGSTLVSGISDYFEVVNYRYNVQSIENIIEWGKIVRDFYSKYAVNLFEKYNSIKAIDELLNSNPKEKVKLCDDLGWRIIKGLIAARLINNPEYNNLRDYYKSLVDDRFQGHFMYDKCNKVIKFLDSHDSEQLKSMI